jgi:hypothetical protein
MLCRRQNVTQRLPNYFSAVVIYMSNNMVAMATGRAGAEQHDVKAQEGKQEEVVCPPILPHVSAEDNMQGNRGR